MLGEIALNEECIVRRAKSFLKFWRYWRWVQLGLGLVCVGWSWSLMFSAPPGQESPLAFGVLHYWVLGALGTVLIVDAISNRRVQDRKALVELGRRLGRAVD